MVLSRTAVLSILIWVQTCLQRLSADGQKLLSVLIWVQTVFKGYRQTTNVAASKERIEHLAKTCYLKAANMAISSFKKFAISKTSRSHLSKILVYARSSMEYFDDSIFYHISGFACLVFLHLLFVDCRFFRVSK